MQPSPSKCHPVNLVGFVFISLNIGYANVVNDISVVCADRGGGDGVGEAVVAVVAIDIGVNHHCARAVGCAVIVIISVVVGVVGVVNVAVVVDPGRTSVIGNVVVIIVFAVIVVVVAGVFVVADVACFNFFFSP